ncbi:MAG: tetratricopeptide repeat protein, partial [bacterium]|nr:tetratricopeptide repeat protein [bacterium]
MKSARFLTAVLLSLWVLSLLMVSPVLGAPKSKSESTTKSKEAPKDSKKEAKRKAAAQMLKMRKMMALNAKSIEHFKSGQFGRSKATLEEMLKIDPNNGVAHYNLACVYCQLKKPTKAIGELNLAVDNGYLAFNFM